MTRLFLPSDLGDVIDAGLQALQWPKSGVGLYLPRLTYEDLGGSFAVQGVHEYQLVRCLARPRLLQPLLHLVYDAAKSFQIPKTTRRTQDSPAKQRAQFISTLKQSPLQTLPAPVARPDSATPVGSLTPPEAVWVHGPRGIGKSHLLYLAAAHIRKTQPAWRVVYVDFQCSGEPSTAQQSPWHLVDRLANQIEVTYYADEPVVRQVYRLRRLLELEPSQALLSDALHNLFMTIDQHCRETQLTPMWVLDHMRTNELFPQEPACHLVKLLATTCRHPVVYSLGWHDFPFAQLLSVGHRFMVCAGFTRTDARRWVQLQLGPQSARSWLSKDDWELLQAYTGMHPSELCALWQHCISTRPTVLTDDHQALPAPEWHTFVQTRQHTLFQEHKVFYQALSADNQRHLRILVTNNLGSDKSLAVDTLDHRIMFLDHTADSVQPLRFVHRMAEQAVGSFHAHQDPDMAWVTRYVMQADFLTTTKGTVSERYVHWVFRQQQRYAFTATSLDAGHAQETWKTKHCQVQVLRHATDLGQLGANSTIYLPQSSNFPKFDWAIWHGPQQQLLLFQMKVGREVRRYISALSNEDVAPWATAGGLANSQIRIVWLVALDTQAIILRTPLKSRPDHVSLTQQYVSSFQDNPYFSALHDLGRFE
ncbi:hypothetical protein H4R34_000867 [Dimargaris verticillata]|uniref:Uncharacterized protein n=1 Tax=Dimargaris verticillata TaxID=2761393 RepID=A0A9W8EF05_9FUNG|nr:hypothetical protein H4R34_000867 [Dimargaris verticillata]